MSDHARACAKSLIANVRSGHITSYRIISYQIHQRKLGSNTSELRTNRILRLEMMKGGVSSNNI